MLKNIVVPLVVAVIGGLLVFYFTQNPKDRRLKLYDACIVQGGSDKYTNNCCKHLS